MPPPLSASERATERRSGKRRQEAAIQMFRVTRTRSGTFFFFFHFAPLNVLPLGDVSFLTNVLFPSLARSLSLLLAVFFPLRHNAFQNPPPAVRLQRSYPTFKDSLTSGATFQLLMDVLQELNTTQAIWWHISFPQWPT